MKRYMKLGSLWKRDHEKVKAGGRVEIALPVLLTCEAEIILMKNTSEHERAPQWDLFVVTGTDDGERGGAAGSAGQGADDDIPF